MSKNLLTEEEIAGLQGNSCIASVSSRSVQFTGAFLEEATERLKKGETMGAILRSHGIKPETLGKTRVNGLQSRLLHPPKPKDEQAIPEGAIKDGAVDRGKSEEQRLEALESEVAYLRHMVEFLKKIQTAEPEPSKHGSDTS